MRTTKYTFEACIGIDNGYGNDWSTSTIELDANFKPIAISTEFLGNNAEPDYGGTDELIFEEPVAVYRALTKEQLDRLESAIEGFKCGVGGRPDWQLN